MLCPSFEYGQLQLHPTPTLRRHAASNPGLKPNVVNRTRHTRATKAHVRLRAGQQAGASAIASGGP